MKPTNDLFNLIKSLGQAEKRYFVIYSKRHVIGGQNKYLKLFNAIDGLKQYDENQIRKIFKNEKFLNQLSVAKNYLYRLLLKSLASYHNGASAYSKINELIHQAIILTNKDLYPQALGILNKAKNLAVKYESHSQILDILRIEKKIKTVNLRLAELEKNIETTFNQEMENLEKLKNTTQYYHLLMQSYILLTGKEAITKIRSKDELGEYEKIFKDPLLSGAESALSYEAKICYHKINTNYYGKLGNFDKSYEHSKKMIELIESNPRRMSEDISDYIIAINNQLINLRCLKKYDEFFQVKDKFKNIGMIYKRQLPMKLEITVFISSYSPVLRMYIETGNFEEGIKLIPEIKSGLEKYAGKINKRFELTFYYSIAYLYFVQSDFDESLIWVNKILKETEDTGLDIICFTHLLNLIIHYELGNYELLEYKLVSTYRFLSRRKRVYKFEKIILEFIKKSFRMKTNRELTVAFIELRNKLKKLYNEPFEKNALDELDLIAWLDSKIENRSLTEILKKKVGL